MKKFIAGLAITAVSLFALPNDPVELVLLSKAAEKKAVVLASMQLDASTQDAFGKMYDEYQKKLMKQRIKELGLIAQYAQHFTDMTDANADKLIKEWMTVEEAELALKKEYISKFKKVMPSSDVIRYFQIENRLQLMRELKRSSLIPLAIPAQQDLPSK